MYCRKGEKILVEISESPGMNVSREMRDALGYLRELGGKDFRPLPENYPSQILKLEPEAYRGAAYNGNLRGYIVDKILQLMYADPSIVV
jgi:hypothetical protein